MITGASSVYSIIDAAKLARSMVQTINTREQRAER